MAPRKAAVQAELEVSAMAIEPRASSKQIGDKSPKAKAAIVTALAVGFTTDAALTDANHAMNKSHLSGKRFGAMVASGTGTSVALYTAMGHDNKAAWTKQGTAGAKTPTGNLPAAGILGDKRRKATAIPATALEIPVVLEASLKSGDHPINQTALSGKKAGAMVVDSVSGLIYVAEGSTPTAKWTPQSATAAQITPTAATPVVAGKVGDKPRKAKTVVVCAIHVPIVSAQDLLAKSHTLNDTKLSGKTVGALVATTLNNVTTVYMASSSANDGVWVNIKMSASHVTPV